MKNSRWSSSHLCPRNKLVVVLWRIFIIKKIKDMKEEWMKELFGRFYIKNYHANFNSYFALKVKGLTGKNIFIHAQRLPLELVFLMKFVKIQTPSLKKLMSKSVFLKSLIIVDTFMIYSLITLTTFFCKKTGFISINVLILYISSWDGKHYV